MGCKKWQAFAKSREVLIRRRNYSQEEKHGARLFAHPSTRRTGRGI
jgi:hypothetical protein